LNDDASPRLTVVWKWEVHDPKRRSGWRLLSWRMADQDAVAWAKTEGAEIRKVEGSREERRDVDRRYPKL